MKTDPWAYGEEINPNAEFRALVREAAACHDLATLAKLAEQYGTSGVTAALQFDLSWPEESGAAFTLFGETLEYIVRLHAENERKHEEIMRLKHPHVVLSKPPTDADDIPF